MLIDGCGLNRTSPMPETPAGPSTAWNTPIGVPSGGSSPLSDIEWISDQEKPGKEAKKKPSASKALKADAIDRGKGKAKAPDGENKEYCHQCRTAVKEALRCTLLRNTGKGPKATTFRCGRQYCFRDLETKYGMDAASVRAAGRQLGNEDEDAHDPGAPYIFACMACRGTCECSTCRKKRGLEPKGAIPAKENGQSKASKKVAAKKPKPSKRAATEDGEPEGKKAKTSDKPVNNANGARKKTKIKGATNTSIDSSQPGVKGEVTRKAKAKPKIKEIKEVIPPIFERVLTTLSKAEAEARIELREFIFRFKNVLSLPDRNLGPLDDFDRPVAEATVRLLSGALLDLLRNEVEDDEDETLENCREEMRYHADIVRFANVMRKVAPILELDLPVIPGAKDDAKKAQSNSSALRALLDLDEEDSAPLWAAFQSDSGPRRGASKTPLPAEVVGMLLALCDRALRTDRIRQEFESTGGEFEARRKLAADSKALKEEWDQRKKKLAEEKVVATSASATKAWREKQAKEEKDYQMKQAKLNVNLRVFLNRKALRHDPLGIDKDGRIYYLLSPRHIGDDTRAPIGWASGVMVWGRGVAQPSGVAKVGKEEEMDEDLPPEVERWTHFGSHSDVKALAEWVVYIARPPPTQTTPKKRKIMEVLIPRPAKKQQLANGSDASSSLSSLSSPEQGTKNGSSGKHGARPEPLPVDSRGSDSSGLTPPPDDTELERQMSLRTLLLQHKRHDLTPELQQERAKELASRLMEAAEWLELLEYLGLTNET